MAETSLRAYIQQLEGLLSRQALDEVVAHCRYVLETHSKLVAIYRVLGKALLEQGQLTEAADIFRRVLSADPTDLVAHTGLSIIAEEEKAFDRAIWHIERAFEQAPNNTAVQDELRRLRGQPDKIQLTSGALARLYTQGALYQQAIAELTKGIVRNPDRLDLQTLLAQSYWESHQPLKAGRVAARLLERLPHNLQANRILGELWLRTGREDEAEPFLSRLAALDPYLERQIRANGDVVLSDTITIERLEWTDTADLMTVPDAAPDWVSQLEGAFDKPTKTVPEAPAESPPPQAAAVEMATAEGDEDAPGWLGSIASAETTQAIVKAAEDDKVEEEIEVPDWISDLAGDVPIDKIDLPSGLELAADSADVDIDAVPDWLTDIAETDEAPSAEYAPDTGELKAIAEEDVPDWLAQIDVGMAQAPPAVAEDAAPAESEEAPEAEVIEPVKAEPLTPWDPTTIETWEGDADDDAVKAEESEDAIPDWMEEADTLAVEADSAATGVAEESSDKIPDWLASDEEPTVAVQQQEEAEEVPDWLEAETVENDIDSVETKEVVEEALPDWLESAAVAVEEDTPASDGSEDGKEALPSWLEAEMKTIEEEEQVAPPTESPSDPEMPEEEIPEWMEKGEEDSDDALAWLEGLAAQQGADPAEFVATPSAEALEEAKEPVAELAKEDESVGDLDWLREPQESADEPAKPEEAPVAAPAAATDLPDWLAGGDDDKEASSPTPTFASEDEPVTLEDALAAAPAAATDLPDWLAGGDDDKEESAPTPALASADEPATPEEAPLAAPAAATGLPDWLAGDDDDKDKEESAPTPALASADEPTTPEETPVAAPAATGDLPDWLAGSDDDDKEPISALTAEPIAETTEEKADDSEDDDTLGWLEELATEQGAESGKFIATQLKDDEPAATTPSAPEEVTAAEPAGEVPDWLSPGAEEEVSEKESEAKPVAESVPEPTEDESIELDWLSEAVSPEITAESAELADFLSSQQPAPSPQTTPEPEPEPVAATQAELPDWLTVEDGQSAEEDELADFLQQATDEPSKAEPVAATPAPEPVAAAPPPEPEPEPVAAAPPPEPVAAAATPPPSGDHAEQLKFAREQFALKNHEQSLDSYEALISSKQLIADVVADLTRAAASHGAIEPRINRLLGDALMADGKMQEAINAYQGALDKL